MQKAREGKWNGGFAPYGYKLVDGELVINEEEAVAIREIFNQYVHRDVGAGSIARYLESHGISKIARQNGKNPLFDAGLIRRIIQNPVYCGKIAYGRRRTEKVHGTRNDYRLVNKDEYLLVDGIHEAIISEEIWELAQEKVIAQAQKYEKVNTPNGEKTHLLTGLLKCPICGAGMYGNKSIMKKKDGSYYTPYYYYGCKHRKMDRGHKCTFRKQLSEKVLDNAVIEIICNVVNSNKFSCCIKSKIDMEVDCEGLNQEVTNLEKKLRQCYLNKDAILDDLDDLDYEDKHYQRKKEDLDSRLDKIYDKIDEIEETLKEARKKKAAILKEKISGDNIYKALVFFEKTFKALDDHEKRYFLSRIIEKIDVFEDVQPNGQWLKSIQFRLPIIERDIKFILDKGDHVETVCLLSKKP